MRILHLISSFETGGAQKLLSQLAPAQAALGADVSVLVYERVGNSLEQNVVSAGIPVDSLDVRSLKSPAVIPALRRRMRDVDVVHVHLFPCVYHMAMASPGLKASLVYTEHSTHNRRRDRSWLRPVERMVYGRYDIVAGISPMTVANLCAWLKKEPGGKFLTVPNGIDLSVSASDATPPGWSSPFPEGPVVLMVSRFTEAKDQASLIRALPLMRSRDVSVAFAGEGPALEAHRELARELGVEQKVLFLGNRDDVPQLMHRADVGVQSSHWEGFGLTAVEFMSAGVPVVASDVPGLHDVVAGAGQLVAPGDPQALAQTLDTVLASESLRDDMINKGKERARNYSIEAAARRYLDIYASLRQSK